MRSSAKFNIVGFVSRMDFETDLIRCYKSVSFEYEIKYFTSLMIFVYILNIKNYSYRKRWKTLKYYLRGRRNFVFNFGSAKLVGDAFRFGLPPTEIDIVVLVAKTTESPDRVRRVLAMSIGESWTVVRTVFLPLYGVLETNSAVFIFSKDSI